jgi:hypothetical protein
LVRAGWLDVAIARAAGLAAVRFSLRFRGWLVTTVIGGSVTPSPRSAGHSCAAAPLTTKESRQQTLRAPHSSARTNE